MNRTLSLSVLGMELSAAMALLWHAVQLRWAPGPAGPVLLASCMVLGYLIATRARRHRMVAGIVLGLGLWLAGLQAQLPLVDQLFRRPRSPFAPTPVAPEETLLTFLASGIVPVALVFALWWRGASLADSADDLGPEDVRGRFVFIAALLLTLIVLMRGFLPIDPISGTAMALIFVISGLVAVGTARQGASDTERGVSSRALVVAAMLFFLLSTLLLMLLLRPGVVAAIGDAVFRVFAALSAAIVFVLDVLDPRQPSGTPIDAPAAPAPASPIRPRSGSLDIQEWPEWLANIARISAGLFVVIIVLYLLWLLFLFLGNLWLRPRGSAYVPVAVERLDEDWTDTLRDSVGDWLGRLRARPSRRPIADPVVDARSAYRALLRWAKLRGLERRPGETTQQLQHRLEIAMPEGREQFAPLTAAYEAERYGRLTPSAERAAELSRRVQRLDA